MSNLTVECAKRPDGSRKGRNGAEVVLLGPASMNLPGGISTIQNAPASIGSYNFAFWSVTGAAGGSFATLNNPVQFQTGDTDMVAKAWYALKEPKPPEGSEVFVDAFDIEKGRFLDDDFVSAKDANNVINSQLTQDANVNGLVPTTSTALVDAAAAIGFAKFDRWECVSGQEAINAGTMTAAEDSNADTVAFYKDSQTTPSFGYLGKLFEYQTWVSWGVTVDGGGPTGKGPVPPWTPLTLDFAAGLALAEAAYRLDPKLRGDALKVAAKQVALAAQAISKEMKARAG